VDELMKITDVKCFPLWGGGRNFFFVKVETDAGLYGVGEAGITWREVAVAGFVEHLKPALLGADATRIEHLWQLMFRGGFFPAGRVGCAALSAIDMALWDLRGKALGVPVYDLLGGLVRDRAVCYPHTGAPTPEEAAEKARQLVAEGWKFIRLSVPSPWSRTVPTSSRTPSAPRTPPATGTCASTSPPRSPPGNSSRPSGSSGR
jgi:L-alanine-DL-glutamate epimerase-like enolase superfamily enzyme